MIRVAPLIVVVAALFMAVANGKDRAEKEALKAEKAAAKMVTSGKTEEVSKSEPATKSAGFDAFKNVRGKNIFDPTRRGMRVETGPVMPSGPINRSRTLALTGTMVSEGKALAFFGGSAADGSRVISVGNSVANYKVTDIGATQVSLEHEGKSIVLEVGRQLSFESTSGAASAPGPIVEAAPEPAAETTGAPSVPGAAGDKSEILRRMMERRAKENGK